MILQGNDGNLYDVPDNGVYDPTADAATLSQDAAALQLATEQQTATITAQVTANLQTQTDALNAKIAKIQQALAINSSLAATIQPQIDALNTNYAPIAATLPVLAPAQVATPTPDITPEPPTQTANS